MRIIFDQAIVERNIAASPDEINTEMEQKLTAVRIGEKEVRQMAQLQDALVAALVEVQKDLQRAQEIFADRLAGSAISENAWAVYVANYRTPEKIEQLRKLIPRSVEDVKKNSAASSRHAVLLAKLKMALVAEQRTEKDAEAVWRSWTQSAILGARIVVTHQGIADGLKRLGFTNDQRGVRRTTERLKLRGAGQRRGRGAAGSLAGVSRYAAAGGAGVTPWPAVTCATEIWPPSSA